MIDLHCHILPGLDDGAADVAMALAMARILCGDGVTDVVCTPHIRPGVYHNDARSVADAVARLRQALDYEGLALRLHEGADNHVVPDLCAALGSGRALAIAGSRYVLVEPPHHVMPPRLATLFVDLLAQGYVPILTHPERLAWIGQHYATIEALSDTGVWMQLTAGSLEGRFGSMPRYWSERMLSEGRVHVLATDAHDPRRRPPVLSAGRSLAARLVGEREAEHLVLTRPRGILANEAPASLPRPTSVHSQYPVPSVKPEDRNRARYATEQVGARNSHAGAGGPLVRLRHHLG